MIIKQQMKDFTPSADKIIWDVRDADRYQEGHIEYAQNHPLETLNKELLDSTTGDIYVLCGGGTKAERACQYLHELDASRNIIHLSDGTRGAQALGMTIVKP